MAQATLRLLIVDDEPEVRVLFHQYLTKLNLDHLCKVEEASDSREAIAKCDRFKPDAVLLDLKLDPSDLFPEPGDLENLAQKLGGIKVLDHLHKQKYETDVLIISVIQDEATMRACCDKAVKYLGKPLNEQQLLYALKPTFDRLQITLAPQGASGPESVGIVTPGMGGIFRLVQQVAPTKATVLLFGPSGSGKEIVARLIRQHSGKRANCPFLARNCSIGSLFESRFFGHKKGAFTGADRDQPGYFQLAHTGTLFMDEVGDIPLDDQPKLLRALQEGEVEPLGGREVEKVDVRVIAATNRDLDDAVKKGLFRKDLLYRLNSFVIEVPPLCSRLADLDWLVPCCLEKLRSGEGVESYAYTDDAMKKLKEHQWPGNIRELENVLRKAALEASGEPIGAQHITLAGAARDTDTELAEGLSLYATLEENKKRLEENQIRALHDLGKSDAEIWKTMGISRTTGWRKKKGTEVPGE